MPDPVVPPVPPPVVPPVPPAPLWYTGVLDQETVGHAQLKGWDMTDAAKFGAAAAKAHLEAEKFIGVPANQLVRLPKDAADEAGHKALRARLGVPDADTGYDFTTVKDTAGNPVSDALAAALRPALLSAGVAKDAAPAILQAIVKQMEGSNASAAGDKAAALALEKTALAQNWGQNSAVNLLVAQRGAAALGLTAEEVTALENVSGYAKTMEALRRVGTLSGEANFIIGGNTPNPGVMTKESAVARKAELMRDADWTKRWAMGDAAAQREMLGLSTIIAGGDDTDYSRTR